MNPPTAITNTTLTTLKTLINQTTKTLSIIPTPTTNQSPKPPLQNLTPPPNNSFFYLNYPLPVTITNNNTRIPILTLPNTLSRQCNNNNNEIEFPINSITFLPSDIWAITNEIESWTSNYINNCSVSFSIRVLRVFVRLWECDLSRVLEWMVRKSVYYGVVIDFEMRDCLLLLVKLCLKAIVREAVTVLSSNVEEMGGFTVVFKEVVDWLGEKFGVLYGGVNGRVFAVEVVKECVLVSALSGSLFCVDRGERSVKCEVKESGGSVGGSVISVEQVEKAVVALYERALVEEKIRAGRDQMQLSAFQRNMEHSYVTKVAEEERRKLPDYKPIIEHDSLLWNQSRNSDTDKTKTREELLAEERDYKRRRMSYRGKKSKRSAVEVMRDIIEVYMDEIKQSGTMGSTSESVEESGKKNKLLEDYTNNQSSSRDCHDHQDLNKNVDIMKDDRYDYLEMRDGRRSDSYSREPHHRERRDRSNSKSREENYHKTERRKREHNSRKRERDEDDREYRDSGRRRTMRDDRERYEDYSTDRDRERRKTKSSSSSRPERFNEFEDRYDPTESREES